MRILETGLIVVQAGALRLLRIDRSSPKSGCLTRLLRAAAALHFRPL